MFTIPDIRVGELLSCGSLGVFPLYSEPSLFPDRTLDYLLPHEAMDRGTVVVTEVSEAGSVPDLLVRNDSDLPVLMLDGTELRGGKQSRVLNATVLLGGWSQTHIPCPALKWEGGMGCPGTSALVRTARRRFGV